MKCEHCTNDMVWVGSIQSGCMVCTYCVDYGPDITIDDSHGYNWLDGNFIPTPEWIDTDVGGVKGKYCIRRPSDTPHLGDTRIVNGETETYCDGTWWIAE